MEMKTTHPSNQEYELLDPVLQEIGEIKLNIHRIKNRVGVIKAFYQHVRSSAVPTVRRELTDKINAEADIILTTLTKISDVFTKWTDTPGRQYNVQTKELERQVFAQLKEVLSEYDCILNEHRNLSLSELQRMLKVTSTSSEIGGKAGNAFVVDQAHIRSLDEETHIEIEERYSQILQTDRILRMLKNKYGYFLEDSNFTDIALLQLDRILERSHVIPSSNSSYKRRTITIIAALLVVMTTSASIYLLSQTY